MAIILSFSSYLREGLSAQCTNNNTFIADLTPDYAGDTTFLSCIKAGQYISAKVETGNIYIFSTCGYVGFNTQMTLRNSSGTVWYAFNDNFCGQQSQISWTATFSGSVRLLIDEAPSCLHDTICQEIWVTQICQANAGSTSILKNGSSTTSPVFLCEGTDTLYLNSNNDYTLPAADSGETAELMYMVYDCPKTSYNPSLDTCFSGIFLPGKNIMETNPGVLNTGQKYYLIPVTVDDGDNGLNPNGQINIDNNGDSCYDFGNAIEVFYLNPIAFSSNLDCENKSVLVNIFGGTSEFDSSSYTITNTGAGMITGLPVVHGGVIEITGLVNGDYYSFTVSGSNGCTAAFSGGPLSLPNAGNDSSVRICSGDSSFYMETLISGNYDSTGTWYNPSNVMSSGLFTPGTSSTGIWKYVINGYSVCDNDTSFIDVQMDSLMEAGNSSVTTICQYSPAISFWSKLSAGADSGGVWYLPNGNIFSGTANYGTSYIPAVTYKYVVNINSSCDRDSSFHQMLMNRYPKAGNDASTMVCSNASPFLMRSKLTGSPDAGGTWFNSSQTSRSGTFNPATESAGVYMYVVYGTSPCPNDTSYLTIGISVAANAGIGQSVNICRTDTIQNLFAFLSGNPNTSGSWTNPLGNSVPSNTVNPANALSGNYKYTVSATAPCSTSFSTVTISFINPPDPGNNDSIFVCSNDSQVNLFSQISGNPASGGIWLDPASFVFSGIFSPVLHSSGVYIYRVAGSTPCPDSNSYHLVQSVLAPDPGRDTFLKFCSYDGLIDVFQLIGSSPDSGGIWRDPLNNVFQMPFDPATDSGGIYSYTIAGTSPCPDSTSKINIQVNQSPDPGLNSFLNVCSTDSSLSLFSVLNGSPDSGGIWYDSSNNVISGIFNPSAQTSGLYQYEVTGLQPCRDSSAFVQVSVYTHLNPGFGSNMNFCSNDSSVDLFSSLTGNPDTVGYWKSPLGIVFSGLLQPGSDTSGIYRYIIPSIGSCKDTSSAINVVISLAPNPGLGGIKLFCSNDSSVLLFSFLTSSPDTSGNWKYPGGQPFSGLFNPGQDTMGKYTYTVAGAGSCADSSSYLLINTSRFANAGINGNRLSCETDSAFMLFTVLGGNPDSTGVWKNSSGNVSSSVFNPAIDTSSFYTYTVPGKSPCRDSTSYVFITVVKNVNPGRDTSLQFCDIMSPLQLMNILPGNPDPGGFWLKPDSSSFNGILDPASDTNGFYVYSISGLPPCSDKSSKIQVVIENFYPAGTDASFEICESQPPFNFFNLLGGEPGPSGFWTNPLNQAFNGLSDNTVLINGKYKYTIINPVPCPADSAYVELSVSSPPNAGFGSDIIVCEDGELIELFGELTQNPDSNGLWFDANGNIFSGFFDPANHHSGDYYYVVGGQHPCENDSARIGIQVLNLADAGNDQNFKLCWNAEVSLSDLLDSTSDKNGYWLDSNKAVINGLFTANETGGGKFYYVAGGGEFCPRDTMEAQITLIDEFNINAGPDIYLVIGESKPLKVSSFQALTFNWFPEEGLSNSNIPNPKVFTEISTEYIATGTDQFNCRNSDTVMVTVLPKILIPNSFTPNGDGINDTWFVEGLVEYPRAIIRVLNEDNFEVFSTDDPFERWDGSYEGKILPMGIYIYILEFSDVYSREKETGKLNLIR